MDITPHPNLLKSLRGEKTDYVKLIGEGVDNAFDAGAEAVKITFTPDEISFTDNGSGITRDRISALFSLGEHGQMTTTQLGRFGIGIKSQAVNCGDVLIIDSISRDGHVSAKANWRNVVKNGRWEIDDPWWQPYLVDAQHGTTIRITELRTEPKINEEKVANDLALRFHPALVEGRQILLNGSPISKVDEPAMEDIVAATIALSGGRSAHLRAGILVHPGKLHHVHVSYRHRVIIPGSPIGCRDYGGINKLFARVRISGPWHLGKFKDELSDTEEQEELEEAVFEQLRPLLEKVNSASFDARVHQMAQLVNEGLPSQLRVRPKAQAEPGKGSSEKRSTKQGEADVEKSTVSETGPARAKTAPKDRLLVTFDGVAEEDGIGSFDHSGKILRVNLSRDDQYISRLLAARDQELAADTLRTIALMLFERGREEHRIQTELELDGTFGKRVSNLLARQESARPAKASAQ